MPHRKKINERKSFALRYSLYGLGFGFIFPVLGLITYTSEHHFILSWNVIYEYIITEPLLIIICFAPPILMAAGFLIGLSSERIYRYAKAETTARFQRMIEYAGDIFYTSDAFGYFRYINSRVQKELGYAPGELLGKHYTEIIAPEWKERVVAFYMNQMKAKNPESIFEFEVLCKNGEPCWIEQTITLRFKDEKVIGYNGIVRKISERKEHEKIIRELHKNLEEKVAEAEMMNKELDAFTYTVSHDLRAPLRHQIVAADMLKEDFSDTLPAEASELCDTIYKSARRMTTLIDDLLRFSKLGKQPLHLSNNNMKNMVEVILRELGSTYDSKRVQVSIDENLPDALSDASMTRQVWTNFISNAIKYSSKKEQPIIEIGWNIMDKEAVYFVKDNGAGFDMEQYNKLFTPFSRLHGSHEFNGNGLGLNIVKRIIEKHRGRVWAEGKPNEGATFYFSLPRQN